MQPNSHANYALTKEQEPNDAFNPNANEEVAGSALSRDLKLRVLVQLWPRFNASPLKLAYFFNTSCRFSCFAKFDMLNKLTPFWGSGSKKSQKHSLLIASGRLNNGLITLFVFCCCCFLADLLAWHAHFGHLHNCVAFIYLNFSANFHLEFAYEHFH